MDTQQLDLTTLQAALGDAHERFGSVTDGKNADYVPYLATVPSRLFGLAAVTVDGQIATAGDTDYAFAIESISKVFTLSYVLDKLGAETFPSRIGADATGQPFNSVIAIELHGGRPLNPFVNAGAMATTSLVDGDSYDRRWGHIINTMGSFAGRELAVNEEVYRSEAATNQHNRGIAWLLSSYSTLSGDPMEACDLYTRQCSVNVTARDLAVMAATLAGGGVNPLTGKRAIQAGSVPKVLAEMAMNGLYDSTGDWQYAVGLPAKSGVGGGIMAVVPGRMGIAAFSPPLDSFGNSVRAQRAIQSISALLGLNLFAPPPHTLSRP